MTGWIILFAVSFGLALYTFLVYPALLWLIVRIKKPLSQTTPIDRVAGAATAPPLKVSIVVAAYNEQETISATLKSLLAQDYPRDLREIVVFSDGSTDTTDEIVKQFAPHGVRLIRFEGRIGKTECQNRVVERLTGDVVVFSDSNVRWQRDAVRILVQPFTDRQVACTTGALHLVKPLPQPVTQQDGPQLERVDEGLFRRLDHAIKRGESALLSTIGVNGPMYAVRRSEYVRLQAHLVSDLVLPVLIAARGRRVVYVPEAIGFEPASRSVWFEFHRKRRLVTQGWVALPLLFRAADPIKRPALSALLISHKVLRWLGIELLALSFIATLVLAALGQPWFILALAVELAALITAGLGLLFSDDQRGESPLLAALSFFVLTNIAGLVGTIDYFRGKTATRWTTLRT